MLKAILLYLSLLFFTGLSIKAQELVPSVDSAVITFKLYNPENNEAWERIALRISAKKNSSIYHLKTNEQGKASVLLPTKDIYTINLEQLPNLGTIEVGEGAYQKHIIPIPYNGKGIEQIPIINEKELMVRIILEISDGSPNPSPEKISIWDEVNQKNYEVTSNHNGQAALRLPRNGKFTVSLNGAKDYYRFGIPDLKYDIWEERILFERKPGHYLFPSLTHGLINFRYLDMNNKVVPNEAFLIECKETAKVYSCSTNQYGIAQVLLPLGYNYLFSTTYNPHFETMRVALNEGFDIFEFEILYQSPSSEEWAKKIADLEAISALRDSIARIMETHKTSIDPDKNEKIVNKEEKDAPIAIRNLKTFKVRKAVEKKALQHQQCLKKDSLHFSKCNKPVLSTLTRFKGDWKKKIIVTDVTASMDPYMEEVLVWHALNLLKGTESKYIFFNDGDNKITSQKKIGSTGGIYYCQGKLDDLGVIITKMQEAAKPRMGGGEPPENDIEALLAGLTHRDSIEEIILIADAHSRIRDMELLINVNVPIRIILCGAEEKNQFYIQEADVNEQYLTIAHRTQGSVHTLSQDIWDLSKKSDGDTIELRGIRYLLKNHQFIRM